MRSAHDIRPGFVDCGVDHVGGGVEQTVLAAADDFAGVVDEDEVGFGHEAEGAAEGVHPEAVGLYGVAERDVAGDTFVEAVFAEDAEGGGEAAFEVFALFVLVGEGWGSGWMWLVGSLESELMGNVMLLMGRNKAGHVSHTRPKVHVQDITRRNVEVVEVISGSLRERTYEGKLVILPWAMFFFTPGSRGAVPLLTGTSLPSGAVPVVSSE